MRVLCIFCDMLKADKISILNPKEERSKLEDILEELGGRVFKNTFSTSPDTGRALACFFSGKLNKNNGCWYQWQYPKYYLTEEKNLKQILDSNNIKNTFISHGTNIKLGAYLGNENKILRLGIKKNALENILKKLKKEQSEKEFIFIGLEDYHYVSDVYGINSKSNLLAKNILGDSLEKIFKILNKDDFDYIFLFSDHGHKEKIEQTKRGNLLLLNSDRTRSFLQIRKKYEKELIKDEGIKTLYDFLPTILEIYNLKYEKDYYDGENYFKINDNRIITLEGNENFFKCYSDLAIWGAVNKEYIFLTNKNEEVILKNIVGENIVVNNLNYLLKENFISKMEEETVAFSKEILMEKDKILEAKYRSKLINKSFLSDYLYSNGKIISYKFLIKYFVKKIILALKLEEIYYHIFYRRKYDK